MRLFILLSMLSVPAFAAKSELEPRPTTEGQVQVCDAKANKTKSVEHGKCAPAQKLPSTMQSLGERKSK